MMQRGSHPMIFSTDMEPSQTSRTIISSFMESIISIIDEAINKRGGGIV